MREPRHEGVLGWRFGVVVKCFEGWLGSRVLTVVSKTQGSLRAGCVCTDVRS